MMSFRTASRRTKGHCFTKRIERERKTTVAVK